MKPSLCYVSPAVRPAAVRHWFRKLTDLRASSENKEPLQPQMIPQKKEGTLPERAERCCTYI